MKRLADLFVLLVIALHLGFLLLEMFYWDHDIGRRIFAMTPDQSATSAVLAANQGLYNGFLAAGLIWGLIARKRDVLVFFLLCVIAAGLFGAVTAKETILFTQAAPGALALAFVLMSPRRMPRL